jgi:hypothetical protein
MPPSTTPADAPYRYARHHEAAFRATNPAERLYHAAEAGALLDLAAPFVARAQALYITPLAIAGQNIATATNAANSATTGIQSHMAEVFAHGPSAFRGLDAFLKSHTATEATAALRIAPEQFGAVRDRKAIGPRTDRLVTAFSDATTAVRLAIAHRDTVAQRPVKSPAIAFGIRMHNAIASTESHHPPVPPTRLADIDWKCLTLAAIPPVAYQQLAAYLHVREASETWNHKAANQTSATPLTRFHNDVTSFAKVSQIAAGMPPDVTPMLPEIASAIHDLSRPIATALNASARDLLADSTLSPAALFGQSGAATVARYADNVPSSPFADSAAMSAEAEQGAELE